MLSQFFALVAGALMLMVCGTYILSVWRGPTVPNPASWLIACLVSTVNTVSYAMVLEGELHSLLLPVTVNLCMVSILLMALSLGKVSKIDGLDKLTVFIVGVVISLWWLTQDAVVAQILIQVAGTMAFVAVIRGLITGRGVELWWQWAIGGLSYIAGFMAVWLKDVYAPIELLFPLVCIICNLAVSITAATTYDRNTQLLNQQTNSTQAE